MTEVIFCFQPQNILFDESSGEVKVTDFGVATFINENTTDVNDGRMSANVRRTTKKGTEQYMSPEQVTYWKAGHIGRSSPMRCLDKTLTVPPCAVAHRLSQFSLYCIIIKIRQIN